MYDNELMINIDRRFVQTQERILKYFDKEMFNLAQYTYKQIEKMGKKEKKLRKR